MMIAHTFIRHRQPGMLERTITIGLSLEEYRMIGWRIGWVVGQPQSSRTSLGFTSTTPLTPSGMAQA